MLIKSCLIGSSENEMYGGISSKLKWLIVCLFKDCLYLAFLFCFFPLFLSLDRTINLSHVGILSDKKLI